MNRAFLDTNVLIYLIDNEAGRAERSTEVLTAGGVISVQVLNEFVSVSRRKYHLDWEAVEAWLTLFRAALEVEPLTSETQAQATEIARRHRLDIFDATILAAAEQAGCDVLYTEDLQHGSTLAGVEIRNPY